MIFCLLAWNVTQQSLDTILPLDVVTLSLLNCKLTLLLRSSEWNAQWTPIGMGAVLRKVYMMCSNIIFFQKT